MKMIEFIEQDEYCKVNNVPEGIGCDGCPAKDKNMCADRLRGLCGKLLKLWNENIGSQKWKRICEEIKKFGLTDYNILALYRGIIEFNE